LAVSEPTSESVVVESGPLLSEPTSVVVESVGPFLLESPSVLVVEKGSLFDVVLISSSACELVKGAINIGLPIVGSSTVAVTVAVSVKKREQVEIVNLYRAFFCVSSINQKFSSYICLSSTHQPKPIVRGNPIIRIIYYLTNDRLYERNEMGSTEI
jgi:hypothetical protein